MFYLNIKQTDKGKKLLNKLFSAFFLLSIISQPLLSMESTTKTYFEFPKPTGAYAVGTKLFNWTDNSRNRELMGQVWYPSTGKTGLTAPYAYETREICKRALTAQGIGEEKTRILDLLRTHAIPDIPVCRQQAPYPFVIFGHGSACTRGYYSLFCEEIASHGYVVAMVMHKGVSNLIRFADGHEVGLDPNLEKNLLQICEGCFSDIEFMLNQTIAGALGVELTSICDFGNIGIIGHSLGAMMALQVCRRDIRVKAGISLDGSLQGPDATVPFHKPFLFMRASNYYEFFAHEFENADNKDLLESLGVTQDTFFGSIERFCKENGKDTIQIVVNGAQHMTFSDEPILNDFLTKIFGSSIDLSTLEDTQTLPLPEILNVIRVGIISFLNKFLKGQETTFSTLVRHYADHEDFDFYIPATFAGHTEAEINPIPFDTYVGQYQLGKDLVISITKDFNNLYAQIAGQPKFQIFPESETKFFFTVVDAQISFVKDNQEQVTKLILHQNGTNIPAEKIG